MSMDIVPIWVLFAATIIIVMIAIGAGYRLGNVAQRRFGDEKESSVSARTAGVLGLLAFILAFTFGIATDRYDSRKALVRDEANSIRTAWFRSDFLPEPEHGEALGLLRKYVDIRLAVVKSSDVDQVRKAMTESVHIQHQLWDIAVVNARKDMNSDIGALYIESLNEMTNIQAMRVAVGLQARIPNGIWLALYVLVILGMIGVGYHTAVAGSGRRSWASPILAVSFALVIVLIASLDRPAGTYITVSQQPLVDLRASMGPGPGEKP